MDQLDFDLELNGNKRHIVIKKEDDGSYLVKLETVENCNVKTSKQ